MGYELHIHRSEDWLDASENPITLAEWAEYVERSPDLRMDNFAEAPLDDGSVLRVEEEGIAVWTGHPTQPDDAWIGYEPGRVVVKSPDEPMVRRMYEVAEALGARLQGDDGEFYGPDGQPVPE
jgi:hypothetical protein